MFANRAAAADDEEDGEFPFLQEVHSARGQYKIEYDPAKRVTIRNRAHKNLTPTAALCLYTA
jgi:hypothetical protein